MDFYSLFILSLLAIVLGALAIVVLCLAFCSILELEYQVEKKKQNEISKFEANKLFEDYFKG